MNVQAVLALLLVQLLFGALPVVSKFVLAHAHPLFVVVLRSLFATFFFLFFYQFSTQKNSLPALQEPSETSSGTHALLQVETYGRTLPVSVHLRLLVLAFFGVTFNQMALFIALPETSAAITSIITPSIALFTLFFSVFLGRESFRLVSFVAIFMGGAGVLLVVNPFSGVSASSGSGLHGETWADLLNVLSAASYAFYLALVGKLPSQLGGLRFSALFFMYGLVLNAIFMLLHAQMAGWGWITLPESYALTTPLRDLPSSFWTGLAFLLFGATAMTYFLNMWALQRVKPSLVGGFVCLQTVFGLFLSQRILNEPLSANMIYGSMLIIVGVLLLGYQHFTEHKKISVNSFLSE